MFHINMLWKPLFLLIFTHYVQSFDENSMHVVRDNILRKIVQKTYDTRPIELLDTDNDVGEPLILTPFIENNKIMEARQAAFVNDTFLLPGIKSYAGYLTVNKEHKGNLWFWYFPVQSKPLNETPLILWLQGGPGGSSLFGLFEEIGPFTAIDNQTLKENKYSWGKNHSLLFIDNPVGAGYSFTDKDGFATNQTTIGENLYTALQQFLTIFPELRTAPLFIAGESYAGKHIPSIGIQIFWRRDPSEPPINLQGLAIGNGFIDPITLLRYSYFLREVGLLDDRTADIIKSLEAITAEFISKDPFEAFIMFNSIMDIIYKSTELPDKYNYLSGDTHLFGAYTKFVQTPNMRRALHVGKTKFSPHDAVVEHLTRDFMNSAKPWFQELLDHYRILVYSGHLDCVVPYHASVNTYKSLNYTGAQKYQKAKRHTWYHNHTLAGYYKRGGNLLEVMVRGAGHMVPIDKPAQSLGLITAFIQNVSLQEDTAHLVN